MKYKVIDLFCGVGGFSYGFEMTNKFDVILGADIWDVALDTFKENHKETELIHEDLTQMDLDFWKKYTNKADVIIAGPPCQGFSMSGKRDINDERNDLFEEVIRISKVVNPKVIVIENVVGLLSMKNNEGVLIKDLIIDKFIEIGYSNVKFEILNAADYGVPQARRRVVFIATKDLDVEFPKPYLTEENYVTVGEAIGNVHPDNDTYTEATSDYQKLMKGKSNLITNHDKRKSNALVTERMSHIPQGGNWKDIPEHLGTGGGTHSNAYKRLDESKPSITMKHAAKSMIIHPNRDRILTIREVARLQSFPDDFTFTGSVSNQHQQLANAVPPLLGKAIALSIFQELENEKN